MTMSQEPDTELVDPDLGELEEARPGTRDETETQEGDDGDNSDTLDSSVEETGSPISEMSPPRGIGSRYPTRVRHRPLLNTVGRVLNA